MRNFVDYYIKYTERLSKINDAAANAPKELIRQMEVQYRKRVKEIAHFISDMEFGHKILMVAGPSCAGKTTTSAMLCEQLKKKQIGVLQISLDDFFLGAGYAPLLPDGTRDYENIEALDIKTMQRCLLELISTGECDLPVFDFNSGSRSDKINHVKIGANDAVIVEGIHALNPIVTDCLPDKQMLKMYISVKQGIKHGDEIVLDHSDLRLIRRLVRDSKFRNSPPENTFNMWKQVCVGEELYIQPYKRLATITINTIHIYEPCVFRNQAIELLRKIENQSRHYDKAQSLIESISRFEVIPENLIPENSLMREFIGGSIY